MKCGIHHNEVRSNTLNDRTNRTEQGVAHYSAARPWNEIPLNIGQSLAIYTFKRS